MNKLSNNWVAPLWLESKVPAFLSVQLADELCLSDDLSQCDKTTSIRSGSTLILEVRIDTDMHLGGSESYGILNLEIFEIYIKERNKNNQNITCFGIRDRTGRTGIIIDERNFLISNECVPFAALLAKECSSLKIIQVRPLQQVTRESNCAFTTFLENITHTL